MEMESVLIFYILILMDSENKTNLPKDTIFENAFSSEKIMLLSFFDNTPIYGHIDEDLHDNESCL